MLGDAFDQSHIVCNQFGTSLGIAMRSPFSVHLLVLLVQGNAVVTGNEALESIRFKIGEGNCLVHMILFI